VYQGIDGPGSYKVFSKERDYIQENYPEAMQYDYVLFSETNEYGSYLVLYDRRNQHIYRVSRQDSTLLYRLSTTTIEYTSIENKDLPWESYLLPYEGTVYVVNNQIESVLSNIHFEQEQGYIGENELYIEDNGEFMIFATAIYNEGSFDRKTITAYQFGVHQKGYPYWNNSGFSVECDVSIDTIVPKEDKSGFTISYVEEGIRKVAEFGIDYQRHEIILVQVHEQ
ncbi:MAG: hypothetical protein JW708_12095, partial [Vallitaleaceae bacterium]|nr:hypothetical protein [Vallitaleaceae bacterium]